METRRNRFILLFLAIIGSSYANAQEKSASSAEDIAKKLNNPVASLISVPFQNNVDYGIGAYNGSKFTLNVQPVIPFSLSSKLNLITRYIVPIVDQYDITGEGNHEFGLSDATISAFLSPSDSKNGWIWGAGPAFLIPTGTNDLLSTRKWGIGPTVLVLRQTKGWTYGMLANQLWSVAGDKDRNDVNQLFFQPFFAFNWKSGAGLGMNSEMTFDWQNDATTVFLNPSISGIISLGKQLTSLAIGPRIPLTAPSGNKPNFGLRAVFTFVFPQ